ncbi:MAG: Rrf2 family transcriptional regulator [Luteolibacter sp.]
MFTYSKLAQAGIAAVSYLAANGADGRLAGSGEIAEARELSRALVAKILTMLSSAGLVIGKSGPTGGYQLAREPENISLLDVVRVFEDPENQVMCPFGPHWCGVGPRCPLHDTFGELRQQVIDRLERETFAQFVK